MVLLFVEKSHICVIITRFNDSQTKGKYVKTTKLEKTTFPEKTIHRIYTAWAATCCCPVSCIKKEVVYKMNRGRVIFITSCFLLFPHVVLYYTAEEKIWFRNSDVSQSICAELNSLLPPKWIIPLYSLNLTEFPTPPTRTNRRPGVT